MGKVMRGPLLETNARKTKNEGIAEKGIKVYLNLLAAGMSEYEAQNLAEIDDDLAKNALKLQKTQTVGLLLETRARKVKNASIISNIAKAISDDIIRDISDGIAEGIAKTRIEIFLNLLSAGISKHEAQYLTEMDDNLVKEALKLQETQAIIPEPPETIARNIKNEGAAEKGIKIFLNLLAAGISECEAQRLTEIDDKLVEKALQDA